MDEMLSEYLEIQVAIEQDESLGKKLKSLFKDEAGAQVAIEEVLKHFPPAKLIECWKNTKEKLLEMQGKEVEKNVSLNDGIYYGCLYVTLMMEDNCEPVDSPVFIALETLLYSSMHLGNEELLKSQCEQVILAGLERLKSRNSRQWAPSQEFLFASLQVIKSMQLSVKLMNAFIQALMPYCSNHYDMVNNLSLADKNSSVGVLAFAALSNLLVKSSEKKQIVFETMFEHIVFTMENNKDLTSFEINVKQSNFKQMIRQVGEELSTSMSPLFFAILRVVERHSKSKSLVSIVNQLPISMFSTFVDVLVRLCNRSYCPQLQAFALNMMESPYITEDREEHAKLENLYSRIADSIVWPLASFDNHAVKESIKIIASMLQIQNAFVRSILRRMIKCKGVMKDLMTFINQYCDNTWKEQKQFNQYYVNVYCRLLILDEQAWNSPQFVLISLLLHANASDLSVCLKDLKALASSPAFLQKEVHVAILNAILVLANKAGPQSVQYLRFLHEIIFGGLKANRCFYNALTLKTINCDLLIKNMVAHHLITQKDIEILSEHCMKLHCWRLLSDVALCMDFQIPRKLHQFAERLQDKSIRNRILKEKSIVYIIQFFASILDRRRSTFHSGEKDILKRFAAFLEGCLLKRNIPIFAMPTAISTMQKCVNILNLSLSRLVNLFNEVEQITQRAFNDLVSSEGDFHSLKILPRDIYYFCEMQMVFPLQSGCESKSFTCTQQTIDSILNAQECIKGILGDFSPLGIALVYCMTKVALRNDQLLDATLSLLYSLIFRQQSRLKECCLDCLYDIALFRTSSFDVLIPYICDFLVSENPQNVIVALNVYSKLLAKDHCIPTDWQTFVIAKSLSNNDVKSLLDRECYDKLMEKLHPYFETYFIHILLYANNICDTKEYYLLPEYRNKVVKGKLPLEQRTAIYKTTIEFFKNDYKSKILKYIYKNLTDKYFEVDHADTMLEDILLVTFESLKQNEFLDAKISYEKTSKQIQQFEKYTSTKVESGRNADEIIVIIIGKLLALLKTMNKQQIIHIKRIVYVLFATIHWYFTELHNFNVDEGSNGECRKNILAVSEIYQEYSSEFEFASNSSS